MVQHCLVCKRKALPRSNEFKVLDEEITISSGKLLRAVLQHIVKCTQVGLEIKPTSTVCHKCYSFLLDYDEHVVKLMNLQKQFKLIYENSLKHMKATPPGRIINLGEEYVTDNLIESEKEPKVEVENEEFLEVEDNDDIQNELNEQSFSDDEETATGSVVEMDDDCAGAQIKATPDVKYHLQNPHYKCAYCKQTFPNRGRLRKHVLQVHTKKEFFCQICGVSCKDEEYLELHMNIHEGKTEYDCRYCEKRFNKRSNVVRHMAKHWDKKKYQCEKCGLQFSETPRLYNHKLLHEAEENPLICNICNMKCKTIRTYKRHMNTHREDRPRYPCHICGKTFSEKFTLKPHLRTHAEYTEAGTSKTKGTSTVTEVTKPDLETTEESELICIICGSIFSSRADHNKHMECEHDVISWGV